MKNCSCYAEIIHHIRLQRSRKDDGLICAAAGDAELQPVRQFGRVRQKSVPIQPGLCLDPGQQADAPQDKLSFQASRGLRHRDDPGDQEPQENGEICAVGGI